MGKIPNDCTEVYGDIAEDVVLASRQPLIPRKPEPTALDGFVACSGLLPESGRSGWVPASALFSQVLSDARPWIRVGPQ